LEQQENSMSSGSFKAEQAERGLTFLAADVRRKQVFPREEVEAALKNYFDVAGRSALSGEWDAWADLFTEDVIYVEHAYGILRGREGIREWVNAVNGSTPTDLQMIDEWHIIDNDLCVVYASNLRPAPDGGAPFQFSATAVLCYAGDGKWCYEEDLYNASEAERVMTAHAVTREGTA
jgi:ketosteroid isomerase-like protein